MHALALRQVWRGRRQVLLDDRLCVVLACQVCICSTERRTNTVTRKLQD